MNNSKLIQRLRKSSQDSYAKVHAEGHAGGTEWATTTAGAEELRRLEELPGLLLRRQSHGDRVGVAVCEDELLRHYSWVAIAGEDYGRYISRPGYIQGFVEGAVEVWVSVKRAL